MKSNYKKIGDYIRQVNVRNDDRKIELLLGVNLDKVFIPSVANTHGTDMTKYKVIKRGQFGCKLMSVGRDKKLPISRLVSYDEALISSAYYVFEVIDQTILNPEYLMMWFLRSESDRFLWFLSGGDIRGRITWDDLCQLPIKIPSITKQKAIVKEYNTVANRIALNKQLNQKLEETAQALYKHWFVDFEFPNEDGKPYKLSGGKMFYNKELDKEVPEEWVISELESICRIIDGDRGKNYPSKKHFFNEGYCLFLNAGNVTKQGFDFSNRSFITKERDELLRKGKLERSDIVLTTRGTVGNAAFYDSELEFEYLRINSGMVILRPKYKSNGGFIYLLITSSSFKGNITNYTSGSAQPQLPIKDLKRIPILLPKEIIIDEFSNLVSKLLKFISINNKYNRSLIKLRELLLSKMTQEVSKEKAVV